MTERYCKVCDGWHDLEIAWPDNCRPEAPQRSDLPFPMLSLDTMDPVQSQVDGMMYTSKAAIRASYKAQGYEEIGNDPSRHKKFERSKPKKESFVQSIKKAEARYERGERALGKAWKKAKA